MTRGHTRGAWVSGSVFFQVKREVSIHNMQSYHSQINADVSFMKKEINNQFTFLYFIVTVIPFFTIVLDNILLRITIDYEKVEKILMIIFIVAGIAGFLSIFFTGIYLYRLIKIKEYKKIKLGYISLFMGVVTIIYGIATIREAIYWD